MTNHELIALAGAPALPGLVFRPFRGDRDFGPMVELINTCSRADSSERVDTVEETANFFAHLHGCDLERDLTFAEADGQVVGYGRGEWWDEAGGPLLYGIYLHVHPDWRAAGLGEAMLGWLETRMREVAAGHDPARSKEFQRYARETELYNTALVEAAGYTVARRFYSMVRPDLEDIPDFPLPEGLEVRPVRPEHYRALWDADIDAFRDHWGFSAPEEEDYERWLQDPTIFQPELWQVAWDVATNEVAGQVRTFISHEENRQLGRLRGYTEFISTRRPYRRRGLARALIVRSLHAQKAAGMTESALGVDSENLSGALRVYEACGFRPVQRSATYRKPMT